MYGGGDAIASPASTALAGYDTVAIRAQPMMIANDDCGGGSDG